MDWTAAVIIPVIFIGMPWLFLHYTTKWKQARGLSIEDEKSLDTMFETARRLEERLMTIERVMTADNPRWRDSGVPQSAEPLNPTTDRRH